MTNIKKPVVRFAPSPTGNLHIGNARPALFNWLFSRKHNGTFVLRFDDTDTARSTKEFADGIERDLNWLGILPDRTERQSLRKAEHDAAAEALKAKGLLYPCYETGDELDRRRKRLMAQGKPPVYDRSALKLSDEEKAELETQGRKPHWRFLLPNHEGDPFNTRRTEVHWEDVIRGTQTVDLASMSDPVLIREDGTYLYTLPSVVDDIDFGITHIIRGDDHVTNTGAQIAVFEALDAKAPEFGHHNLLTTASGEGLSKRLGSLSLANLCNDGFEPMAVASLATLIGTSQNVDAVDTMDKLVERFDPLSVTKSAAKFDEGELDTLNAKLVHELSFEDVKDRLTNIETADNERFWNAIRGNITRVNQAEDWAKAIENPQSASQQPDEQEFLKTAKALLPEGEPDENTWGIWTSSLKEQTGRKGRALFMPLRVALTGLDHGPELAQILPLIGRERTLRRLP